MSVALSMRSWERIQSRPYRIISVVYASVICKTLKENNSAVYMELNQSDILVRLSQKILTQEWLAVATGSCSFLTQI